MNLIAFLSHKDGLNSGGDFDASIPVAFRAKRTADEDEQVKQLVEIWAFLTSAICVCQVVGIILHWLSYT